MTIKVIEHTTFIDYSWHDMMLMMRDAEKKKKKNQK